MKALKTAIHTALRDDADANVGIRALLGQANVTPYGVYQGRWVGTPNFKNGNNLQAYLTWVLTPGVSTGTMASDLATYERTFAVTAWSGTSDNMEDILQRARFVLEGLKRVTLPTVDIELHQIRHESSGPDLLDDKWNVFYRTEHFRAYYREKVTTV
jgi:hypothetical protein